MMIDPVNTNHQKAQNVSEIIRPQMEVLCKPKQLCLPRYEENQNLQNVPLFFNSSLSSFGFCFVRNAK